MSFLSLEFAALALGCIGGYYALPKRYKNAAILAASVLFYYLTAGRYVTWLAAATVITYFAALACDGAKNERAKKTVSAVGVALLLGSLVFFKGLLPALTEAGISLGSISAPLGISFFTFQSVGYIVDVRRGSVRAERDFVAAAAYLTFFVHISSGPIESTQRMLPQFCEEHKLGSARLCEAGRRFLLGAFKKAFIADNIGQFVDAFYYMWQRENGASLALACVLYALQLYFDFSGYVDMMAGVAGAMGFEIAENFCAPYFACSITDIWNRWHISLTSWFREYLYIPLGGSRRGFARKLLNICIVFLLSGIWHGADLSFLIWGAIFAALRAAEELARRYLPPISPKTGAGRAALAALGRVYTLIAWCLAYIFFRLDTASDAAAVIVKIFDFSGWSLSAARERVYLIALSLTDETALYARAMVAAIALAVAALLAAEYFTVYRPARDKHRLDTTSNDLLGALGEWPRFAAELVMLALLLAFGSFGSSSFLYYKF